jgi:hypothetical protein
MAVTHPSLRHGGFIFKGDGDESRLNQQINNTETIKRYGVNSFVGFEFQMAFV